MAKALIRVGYTSYVMDVDQALIVAQAIADAEQYERVYVPSEKSGTGNSHYAHYIWEQEGQDGNISLEVLAESVYRIAKLAGKPIKS